MIVKSLSRKSRSFRQLLAYMTGHGHGKEGEILHNLRRGSPSLLDVRQEFEENARYLPPGRRGVVLYHEILSLGRDDRDLVTVPMLKDLAHRYLLLRAPEALAYGQMHLSQAPHIHLMISGNLIGSERKLTLKRVAFERVKRDLECYQRERYPCLTHSLVFEQDGHERREAPVVRKTWQERERERRQGGEEVRPPSRKEELHQKVTRILATSSSQEEFLKNLSQQGLRFYQRGEGHGLEEIRTGLKHRLKTLGLEETYRETVCRWEAVPERLANLQQLELGKLQAFWKQMGYRQDIALVLRPGNGAGGSQLEKLKELLVRKREQERQRTQGIDLERNRNRDLS